MRVVLTPRWRGRARRAAALAGLGLACTLAHAWLLFGGALQPPHAGVPNKPPVLAVRVLPAQLHAPAAEAVEARWAPQHTVRTVTPAKVHVAAARPEPALALAVPAADSPAPIAEPQAAPTSLHLPPHLLDIPPLPRSAPDESLIVGVPHSGLPMRLRLFIEADGRVSSVEVLDAQPLDVIALEHLARMFSRTAFVPGRREDRDVASFIDVEVSLGGASTAIAQATQAP
jgi:hypothetical protein